ncbi:MAG: hypothetical protein ACW99A_13705 [Candidatus Kariarchaeaceae archaeon]
MSKEDESSSKKIIESIQNQSKEQKEIEKQKILVASETVLNLISSVSDEHPDGIPYTLIHDKTGLSYDLIQVAVMHLIMTKAVLGFINDNSTSDLSDDILILREKRIIDDFESSYRTG